MSDEIKHKQLLHVLKQGKFELKGDAILKVASLIAWYEKLGDKIKEMDMPKVTGDPIQGLEDNAI